MMQTVTKTRSTETNDCRWGSAQDDSLLSQSLGSPSLSRKTSFKRSTSEISSISYCGYLLKRSNLPHADSQGALSRLPLDTLLLPDTVQKEQPPPVGDQDVKDAPSHLPQHLIMNEDSNRQQDMSKSPIEQSLEHIASFFGLVDDEDDEKSSKEMTTDEKPMSVHVSNEAEAPAIVSPLTPPPREDGGTTPSRSAPISVKDDDRPMPPTSMDDDVLRFLYRGDSAPTVMRRCSAEHARTVDGIAPPDDYVDEKDGHIWRAKYCVLEDGILYFYRNASDGESQEAKAERARSLHLYETTPNEPDPEDLSKSPTPRKFLLNSFKPEAGFIYEKRVFLDCVGAVRSAGHGPCSFELLAVEDDDEQDGCSGVDALSKFAFSADKLVLRARNPEEMREWLFQFHRYLATLMKNIIETVAAPHVGDIHHPSFAMNGPYLCQQQPVHDLRMMNFSPRFAHSPTGPVSLSHGHGQSALRRKLGGKSKKGSPSVTSSGVSPPLPAVSSSKPKYVPPHLRNRKQSESDSNMSARYVPPHLRPKGLAVSVVDSPPDLKEERAEPISLLSVQVEDSASSKHLDSSDDEVFEMSIDEPKELGADEGHRGSAFKLGGCADPRVVVGSIVDPFFKSRSASKLGQVHTEDYGGFGGGKHLDDASSSSLQPDASLKWEIGAVSKCGARDSNEDSYLVASNLAGAFADHDASSDLPLWAESGSHHPGLFCVFDGHNGNHAARFAAEKLPNFLLQESRAENRTDRGAFRSDAEATEDILLNAVSSLDEAFCRLCTEDGRDWESGATALIALVVHEHLVLANLGDCRAVMCRSMVASDVVAMEIHNGDRWSELVLDTEEGANMSCYFRELNDIHTPSRPDEHERIKRANGWITTETEIPVGQLQRMDFCDEDVVEILKRCAYTDKNSDTHCSSSAPQRIIEISRVCGDLAVSRSLGDRDYKAVYNDAAALDVSPDDMETSIVCEWQSDMLFLAYPDDHSRRFKGDLVSSVPELQSVKLAETGVFDEFLLLACDGLWDVMDPDDAIRITRKLLFEKKWEAKRAAARLAELAIHLGSSDNVTVIVVRFFRKDFS